MTESPVGWLPPPLVSVVVLTYEPEEAMLMRCLDSVLASTHQPLEVVLVDNGSGNGVAATLAATRPEIRFRALERNLGFAEGINRGVEMSRGALCLLLNPDTEVEPDTVRRLVAAAAQRPGAVAFAPKMLLASDREIIDSVGIILAPSGAAAQRGLGQVDVGQLDREGPIFGVCFGAALIRREAFAPERVGLLEGRFFMFYEDVEWCLRAGIRGESFWAVPEARVYHVHSASTRDRPPGFKFRLIHRNLMLTAGTHLEGRHALRVWLRRTAWLGRNALSGRHPGASLRAAAEAWLAIPTLVAARRAQQRRRVRPDTALFRFSAGEVTHFDADTYQPVFTWAAVVDVLRRLALTSGEARWERAYQYAAAVAQTPLQFQPSTTLEALRRIADPLPPPLVRLVSGIPAFEGTAVAPASTTAAVPDALDGGPTAAVDHPGQAGAGPWTSAPRPEPGDASGRGGVRHGTGAPPGR